MHFLELSLISLTSFMILVENIATARNLLKVTDEAWNEYKASFGKSYDKDEDVIRRNLWEKSIAGLNRYQNGVYHKHMYLDQAREVEVYTPSEEEWIKYKTKFNKSYNNEEDMKRRKEWEKEIKAAKSHNSKWRNYETYFELRIDYFSDFPPRDPSQPIVDPW